jgi:transcription antitermination factor NusG
VGREHSCARHLQVRGYEVFLPCSRQNRRWSDRIKKIERALFPGYVFCRMSGEAVATIVTTPGVVRIVGDGGRAVPIPVDEIVAVQRIVDAGLSVEPWPFLQTGQCIRIGVGPLRGTEGVVIESKDSQRVVVSISLLQRSVAVEVDAGWLSVQ